jgi:hypothetical protein
MLAKVDGDVLIAYPYGTKELRQDNPNVSFPAQLTKEILIQYSVVEVETESMPDDYTQNFAMADPAKINGKWKITWNDTLASAEEIEKRIDHKWQDIRQRRNELLTASDWTQLPDNPLTDEEKQSWAVYRQALRDITGASNPFEIVFPTK